MYGVFDSVDKVKYIKRNIGIYSARLPDTWEQYSLTPGIIIAVTWNNGMIFNWFYDINSSPNILYNVSF